MGDVKEPAQPSGEEEFNPVAQFSPDPITGHFDHREAIRKELLSKLKEEAKSEPNREEEKKPVKRTSEIIGKINEAILTLCDKHKTEKPSSSNPSLVKDQDWLTEAIQQLHLLDDELDGIHSRYIPVQIENKKGQPVTHQILYRDASNLDDKPIKKRNDYANYTIMGLNYLDAALSLIHTQGQQVTEDEYRYLREESKKFFKNMQLSLYPAKERARFLHRVVIPFTAKKLTQSKDDIEKRLAAVTSFSVFDQPNCSVATQFKVNKTDLLHIDVPMSGMLSESLIGDLEYIKHQEKIEKIKVRPWFNHLTDDVKKQIRLHAQDILDGRMISTRLLDTLPSVRFAGEDRIYDITGNYDPNKPIVVSEGHHSGNPAHQFKDKDANLFATKESLAQYKRLTNKKNIVVMSLTTPVKNLLFKLEFDLEKQTASIIEDNFTRNDKSIGFINAPAHGHRRVVRREMQGYEKILQIAKLIENNPDASPPDRTALTRLIHEINILQERTFQSSENDNLEIAARINKMVNIINKYEDVESFAFVIVCKSGKDRTGLQRLANFISDISDYISTKPEADQLTAKKIERAARRAVTRVSPPAKQAGMFASLGAAGLITSIAGKRFIKTISRASPSNWDDGHTTEITRKTADERKGLPADPDLKFWERPRLWKTLATVGFILVGLGLCATGIGTIIGAPLVGTIGFIAVGAGATLFSAVKVTTGGGGWKSKLGYLLFAGAGIALCATGIGAIVGVPMLVGAPAIASQVAVMAGQAISTVGGIALAGSGISDMISEKSIAKKLLGFGKFLLGGLLVVTGVGALGALIGSVASGISSISGVSIPAASSLAASTTGGVTTYVAPAMLATAGTVGASLVLYKNYSKGYRAGESYTSVGAEPTVVNSASTKDDGKPAPSPPSFRSTHATAGKTIAGWGYIEAKHKLSGQGTDGLKLGPERTADSDPNRPAMTEAQPKNRKK